ncbi:site-specific integrase [Streptomyces sp. NPDC090231]
MITEAAGSARLVLARNVVHLDPAGAVFEGMQEGWARQQADRFLKTKTIDPRLRLVKRLEEFTGLYPWQWTPAEGEAFIAHLRSGTKPIQMSTARTYEVTIALFLEYLLDRRYGWVDTCLERFGEAPQEVFHESNSVLHTLEYEADPRRRPLDYDEVQALFDAADARPAKVRGQGRKGAMTALRDAAMLKTAAARRLTSPLELPKRRGAFAVNFQTADEYDQQLRRCLNDTKLPREVRIIGALVRLYALPVTKITEITTDRFHQDGTGSYLTIDRHPVLLPPRLGQLIKDQIAQPRTTTRVSRALDEASPYLLPGNFPHRPRNPRGVGNLLNRHGLPVLSARNTAMIEAVTTLPPIVIADLFGLHPSTAEAWARYANNSWTHYLAARM